MTLALAHRTVFAGGKSSVPRIASQIDAFVQ